jgi:hypothetical protein
VPMQHMLFSSHGCHWKLILANAALADSSLAPISAIYPACSSSYRQLVVTMP